MTRRTGKARTCRHKGCERPSRGTFCDRCWSAVPGWLKAALARARAAEDAALITGLIARASDAIAAARQSRPPHRTDSLTSYTNTARLLGEHDEVAPAE